MPQEEYTTDEYPGLTVLHGIPESGDITIQWEEPEEESEESDGG